MDIQGLPLEFIILHFHFQEVTQSETDLFAGNYPYTTTGNNVYSLIPITDM